MEILREIHNRLINKLGAVYEREFLTVDNAQIMIGFIGFRGVGKTTFLLNYIKKHYGLDNRALYVSADNIYFSDNTLFDLARSFVNNDGGELLCIDEIHKYKDWAQELKNIYDSFPGLRIIFSGSSSIKISEQKYDLSRRAVLKYVPGFSFREWLEYKYGYNLPILTLENVLEGKTIPVEIVSVEKILGLFKEYLKVGYYPVSKIINDEQLYIETLVNSIEKVIYSDIASYYSLNTKTLDVLKKILYFIVTIAPGKINPNSLGNSLKKHHQDVENYLDIMRYSSLLRYLLIDKRGHSLVRNAEKVYMDNTNLLYAIAKSIGKLEQIGSFRETFVINAIENAGYNVFYIKNGDFCVENYVLEVGGAGKDNKQIKDVENSFLLKDNILVKFDNHIPLFLLGFLY